ncbi:MAG: glycosyl transferase family 1 [Deltaproteobacteria bacterium CG11_big_fil_rev_8_21_14_0_20_49_13]|nr:MAG: glycosyl transferase family 1 [Deltaproteobacteria bacterium CG11_big_fil_rev_8_21_14_0_20_49_13]
MPKLSDYEPIVGKVVIDELANLAGLLKGKRIQNINSTAVGGGVAEILNRMVPLLQELGVDAKWDVIKGGEDFFNVTKAIHNALHGAPVDITEAMWKAFWETGDKNNQDLKCDADIVFVHDPQPIKLVDQKRDNKWLWRCHVDVSIADPNVWDVLKQYIVKYDSAVFSAPSFSKPLPIRQFLISPSIDPLSDKNRELSEEEIEKVLDHYELRRNKPIVTQISRFDRLKDPLGVIAAYRNVKKYNDCQLVLAGGTAVDDPESVAVLAEVQNEARSDKDIHVILMAQNDIHINALQRASDVIVQKSLKEGFGLTVTEALWKSKPVVASAVGGIPLQVKHKFHGLLCHSPEGAAFAIKQLLQNPEFAQQLAANGREHVKQNFLLTRHLKEYMLLFLSLFHTDDIVNL